MKRWPDFDRSGDLPIGVHKATLSEVIEHFCRGSLRRQTVARRLERIYRFAQSMGHLGRFVIFGSFVTAKPEPNDVDIFMLMEDTFDSNQVTGEAAIIFDNMAAQNLEGASVFWIRRLAAIDGEDAALEHWQIKRDKTKRGIVEVMPDA